MQLSNPIAERTSGGTIHQCKDKGTGVSFSMPDPRNVAHDKKIKQEKKHGETEPSASSKAAPAEVTESTASPAAKEAPAPGILEKSLTVLSKLKDLEFHSRANIETIAEMTLTIEEELKQKEFSEPIGALYSAQDNFHSKIAALIESYSIKCESMK
jgi:hypothetical protein